MFFKLRVRNILTIFYLFVILMILSCKSNSDYELFAFKNSQNDWGYFDHDGKIIINPQFKTANPFYNGLARVKVETDSGNKFCFINTKGEYDIFKNWDFASDFSDGLAIVRNDLGYPQAIDTNLDVVLEFPDAYAVSSFAEGRAFKIMQTKDHFRLELINKKGEVFFNKILDDFFILNHFKNGVSSYRKGLISDTNHPLNFVLLKKDGQTILYDGKELKDICFLSHFNSGIAMALNCKGNDKWGLVNKQGEILVNPIYGRMFPDGNDYIVKMGDKWGWIDAEGKFVINPHFYDVRNRGFNGTDLAPVKIGKKWGFINKNGKLEINPQFESVSPFFGKVALVYKKGRGHGLIDTDGKFVKSPQFYDVLPHYYKKKFETIPESELDLFYYEHKSNTSIASGNLFIKSEFIDVDSMIDIIKSNINENGIYGVSAKDFSISNFKKAEASKKLTFTNSCNNSTGYSVKAIGNFEFKYGNGSYNYFNISGVRAIGNQSYNVSNRFEIILNDVNQNDEINCDDKFRLNSITFNANVWEKKKRRQGFREIPYLVFDYKYDELTFFTNFKINFQAKIFDSLTRKKRIDLSDRLYQKLKEDNNFPENLCDFEIDVSENGKVELSMNFCN